jgi:hypothetical protein
MLTSFNVTTTVLIIGTFFVVYVRLMNWLDSNIPLMYYALMIAYTNGLEERLSPLVIYAGLVLTLMLRFEFMNHALTRFVKALEISMLALIVYECGAMVLQY